MMRYLWGILLAGTTVGGTPMAFPVAYALYRKGARMGVIFAYIGASAVCQIPMAAFEASFMGIKFTLIRLTTALLLVILSAMFLESYCKKKGCRINSPCVTVQPEKVLDEYEENAVTVEAVGPLTQLCSNVVDDEGSHA